MFTFKCLKKFSLTLLHSSHSKIAIANAIEFKEGYIFFLKLENTEDVVNKTTSAPNAPGHIVAMYPMGSIMVTQITDYQEEEK